MTEQTASTPDGEQWHHEPRDQDRTPPGEVFEPDFEQIIRDTAELMTLAIYGWPHPLALAEARMALRDLVGRLPSR